LVLDNNYLLILVLDNNYLLILVLDNNYLLILVLDNNYLLTRSLLCFLKLWRLIVNSVGIIEG
jgi:hypothetical protein